METIKHFPAHKLISKSFHHYLEVCPHCNTVSDTPPRFKVTSILVHAARPRRLCKLFILLHFPANPNKTRTCGLSRPPTLSATTRARPVLPPKTREKRATYPRALSLSALPASIAHFAPILARIVVAAQNSPQSSDLRLGRSQSFASSLQGRKRAS